METVIIAKLAAGAVFAGLRVKTIIVASLFFTTVRLVVLPLKLLTEAVFAWSRCWAAGLLDVPVLTLRSCCEYIKWTRLDRGKSDGIRVFENGFLFDDTGNGFDYHC